LFIGGLPFYLRVAFP